MTKGAFLRLLAVFTGALVIHGVLQATILRADIALEDSWFHARYCWMLATGQLPWDGLSFPYMAHSAYADRPVDWALGWHWLVAPFTTLTAEPIDGLRIACVVFNAVLTTVFYGVLRAGGCRRALLWTVFLHLASVFWLFRLHMARPTPLAMAGVLLIWHFATQRRAFAVAVATALTLLVYQVPAWPLLAIGLPVAAIVYEERRVPWALIAAAAVGVAAGLLLHPGFWDVRGGPFSLDRGTFAFFRLVGESVNFAADGGRFVYPDGSSVTVPIPIEMRSPPLWDLIRNFPFVLLVSVISFVALFVKPRTTRSMSSAALALIALAMTTQSGRFAEYLTPFALLAGAEALDGAARAGAKATRTFLLISMGVAALVAVLPARECAQRTSTDLVRARSRDLRAVCGVIESMAKPGDVAWQGSWDEFSNLFYETRSVRFIQGFDPWYMVAHDPADHRAMAAIRARQNTDLGVNDATLRDLLVRQFGARFVILWRRPAEGVFRDGDYDALIKRLTTMPWARAIYTADEAVAFELR